MKKIYMVVLSVFAVSVMLLSGCGSESQNLKTYKASMETFFSNISYLNDEINAIDPSSDTSTQELLDDLDSLNEQFSEMAALEVPQEFANVDELADQASENMSSAVSYYHQAYESDTFLANYEEAANEYYERANVRIKYIIEILHGEDITETQLSFSDESSISETTQVAETQSSDTATDTSEETTTSEN